VEAPLLPIILMSPFNTQYSTSAGASSAIGSGMVRDGNDNSNSTPYVLPGSSGVHFGYGGFSFYNTTTSINTVDYIYYTTMLHQNWTGSINVVLQGISNQSTATGNAYVEVSVACNTGSTSMEGLSFNAYSGGSIDYSSNTLEYKPISLTLNGLNTTGCAAGDVIVFRIARDTTTATGLDTLAAPIIVLGMQIQWQHN
jgi:hypothetical protein